jgi:long-chain acyl-CoA synthetase
VTTETTSASPSASPATDGTRTIAALWRNAGAVERAGPAYLVEEADGWRAVSWAEAARAVDELANGLLALGVRKGDTFGILGATRLEWALFDFALGLVGAIGAPVYASSSPADVRYVLEHSESIGVLVEDEEQRAKVEGLALEHVLSFGDLDDLRARGRSHAAENPGGLAAAADAVGEEDLFTYIYTSGTTGPPKACMIRHRNYFEMADSIRRVDDFLVEDDVMLLYLPLAHNFGRLLHLLGAHLGYTIAFCPDPLRVGEVLTAVHPTILPSVPRVYEKVHAAVVGQFDAATGAKRRIIDWALRVGRRTSELRQRSDEPSRALAVQHRLADRLVYSKVKERLGGRLRLGVSGGAPLAQEIAEFFHALDILIVEGWGQTECTTAATVNRPTRFRFGTVGPALPGFELRAAEDGELLLRSETVFAGYYKDEQATREVLDADGWLRTGDVGEIDADGFVAITDRKKDIIVTAGGKNVAPQNLENDLKTAKEVSQALVVGDRRPYVVALITIDREGTKGMSWDSVQARIAQLVEDVNRDRSRFEQIKKFAILERDFSADEGEITPTLKLKRKICQEHFAAQIEGLYAG